MKIAVIGKGTTGCMSISFLLKHCPDAEIEWYYDPSIPTQSVGEGSNLVLPGELFINLGFNHNDLVNLMGTQKLGIFKRGWGPGHDFLHSFPMPSVGIHFSALTLQDYIFEKIKDKVKIIEENCDPDSIDCDYIMQCSGRPVDYNEFHKSEFIPVNAAHITQCNWDRPDFYYTLTIARPYGWVFGIPLQNRCSIGYLFNKDINNVEEVKEDVKQVLKDYNLIPNGVTNYLEFSNYYRKANHTDRITYNGNASFFLEPLEATTFAMVQKIYHSAADQWFGGAGVEEINRDYIKSIKHIEAVIMLHYYAGSVYDTEFWKYAKQKGIECIEGVTKNDGALLDVLYDVFKQPAEWERGGYGTWTADSFRQNLANLGIESKIKELIHYND